LGGFFFPSQKHETFYSSSVYTRKLNDAQLSAFVDYWYDTGKAMKRDWYCQVDIHGGKNNAITSIASNATAYAHRDFLFMFNLYDRVDKGAYPADGFGFLQSLVRNLTAPVGKDEWGQYINYPDPKLDQATAQNNYWSQHLGRLQRVKAELDPKDLFHYPQGILPAKGN
jgi:hypothetical protein